MELKKRKLQFNFEGKDFEINFPTTRQVRDFDSLLKSKEDKDHFELTVEFLGWLGLDKEVVLDMEPTHIKMIIDSVTDQKKS
jgi:hypothetical protein